MNTPFLDRTTPPTAQEIFDFAARAIHAMPHRALKPGIELCQYRTGDPTCPACIVGQMLTDEETKVPSHVRNNPDNYAMTEAYTLDQIPAEYPGVRGLAELKLLPARLTEHVVLLSGLQTIHDNAGMWDCNGPDPIQMPQRLLNLAIKHGIPSYAVLTELWPGSLPDPY